MSRFKQYRVLLWKNYLLRVRHKGTLALVLLWPLAVFLTLYIIKDSVEPEYIPTCQFQSRALPSAGIMPFIQSYICSLNNQCELLDDFKPIPTFERAKLTPLLSLFQDIVTNQSIVDTLMRLPGTLKLLTSLTTAWDDPNLRSALNTKIPIVKVFKKADAIKTYLTKESNYFNETVVNIVFNGSIKANHITELLGPVDVKDLMCDSKKLSRYISLVIETDIEMVSSVLCSLNETAISQIVNKLKENIDTLRLITLVLDTSIDGVLRKFGISKKESTAIIKNIPNIIALISNFSNTFSKISNVFDVSKADEGGDLLSQAGPYLCGYSILPDSNKLYKTLAKAKDFSGTKELKSLPEGPCRNLYGNISTLENGKIIWSYMKPLLRGKIYYTPENPLSSNIIRSANKTFEEISNFRILITAIYESLELLKNTTSLEKNLGSVLKIPSFSNTLKTIDLNETVLSKVSTNIIGSHTEKVRSLTGLLSEALRCVSVDRFESVASEAALEKIAMESSMSNEFLAGIVFENWDIHTNESKDGEREIKYKIRMSVDNVPTTSRTRSQFWFPGPESDFIENLRYFRGFIQLQDMIDKAITQVLHKSKDSENTYIPLLYDVHTYTQQIPYPCWKKDAFQDGLHISQGLQVCFYFALISFVAVTVRFIVWERETRNSELMLILGVKMSLNTISWLSIALLEIGIILMGILFLLKFCNMLPNADTSLLFLYFVDFGFSVVMFCYMVQSLFKSASLAALAAVIFYLLTYMPFVIVIAMDAFLSYSGQIFMHISMSTSFSFGCLYISRLEAQASGLAWDVIWDPITSEGPSFAITSLIIFADGVLYGIIGFSVGIIKSGFPKIYYKKNERESREKIGVTLSHISQVYNVGRTNERKILNDVNIDLPSGKITALLGENGAGKTTLINILTGTLEPTEGEVLRIGRIGLCPQDDVLFGVLTAREHLLFYIQIATDNPLPECKLLVDTMLEQMDMDDFKTEYTDNLSGGLKRRLCVAIAFIGSPSVVILDEPSSGVDPVARSGLWGLLERLTLGGDFQGTVLLTTHQMDEAELISDSVLVMHQGKILAAGTANELMSKYSSYVLSVCFSDEHTTSSTPMQLRDKIYSIMQAWFPDCNIDSLTDRRIKIMIPFKYSVSNTSRICGALGELETSKIDIGYDYFFIENGGLGDVVLSLCNSDKKLSSSLSKRSANESENYIKIDSDNLQSNVDLDMLLNPTMKKSSLFRAHAEQIYILLWKKTRALSRNWRMLAAVLFFPTILIAVAMGFSKLRPAPDAENALELSTKLYPWSLFLSSSGNDESSIDRLLERKLVSMATSETTEILNYKRETRNCSCYKGTQRCMHTKNIKNYDFFTQIPSSKETLTWLVTTHDQFIQKRYGGWSIENNTNNSTIDAIVWFNNKGYHALPSYLNFLNNALLKLSMDSDEYRIVTFNHPLKLSQVQLSRSTLLQLFADTGISLIIVIGISLVPAGAATYLVRERISQEKRLQILSGVSHAVYWTTAFIFDMTICVCAIILGTIVIEIFGIPVFTAKENLEAICLLLFLYCFACTPLVYLLEKLFLDESLANMCIFCGNVFIAVSTLASILLMDVLGKTQVVEDFRDVLHFILLIVPQFTLADGLIEVSKNYIQASILERFGFETYVSPFSFELIGRHYLSLFFVGLILFLINISLENRMYNCKRSVIKKRARKSLTGDNIVHMERLRITKRSGPLTDVVEVRELTKQYESFCQKPKVAVNDLYLAVPPAECFGLLGKNGAGKSTIFKMLTGEIYPTSGEIIFNDDFKKGAISICPQGHALEPMLTPRELIKFYATIRGIDNIDEIITQTLIQFDLAKYKNVLVKHLSGGNKRKLSVAIAVLGKAQIVLMDEPTSGMDPISRNLLLKSIHQLKLNERGIVMTSHNMVECELICDRVGILCNGKFVAMGSPNALKNKYYDGHIVSVRLPKHTNIADVEAALKLYLEHAHLICRKYQTYFYEVGASVTAGYLFEKINTLSLDFKFDFTITKPSLDQVFIHINNEIENERHNAKPRNGFELNSQYLQQNRRASKTSDHDEYVTHL